MLAIDTETTGVDFYHGARPFFVSMCNTEGEVTYWEFEVNPKTRQVIYKEDDLKDIANVMKQEKDGYLLHNCIFDYNALASIGLWKYIDINEVFDKTHDTLLTAHLLHSNKEKSLDNMCLRWLNLDITKYEKDLEKAVKYCRTHAKDLGWKIAKKDKEDENIMPSAIDKTWQYDYWLPKALAKKLNYPEDHKYYTVLQKYALPDVEVLNHLNRRLQKEVRQRKLGALLDERKKLLKITYNMQRTGITVSSKTLDKVKNEFITESTNLATKCVNIAKCFNYDLVLPKGGSNKSLNSFMLDTLKLPPRYSKKAKTDKPCLDKNVMLHYQETLPQRSISLLFINSLLSKRARDVAVSYMKSYQRFWLPTEHTDYFVLHPSLNLTGTNTLRCSSSHPNEQNISKREGFNVRQCFGPKPGREWWSLDGKNIELRIPAYESGQKEFVDLFEKPDEPPYYGSNHLLIFHVLWPELWEAAVREVGEEQAGNYCKKKYNSTYYQWTKNGNFAIQYGAIDREDGEGTADRAYHQVGAHSKLKKRFTKQEQLNQYWLKFANKHGYVETIPDKNVDPTRGYPLLCKRTDYGRVKPTIPLSYHVQGTAMWLTARCKVEVSYKLEDYHKLDGLDYFLIMEVHDEIVLDFPAKGKEALEYDLSQEKLAKQKNTKVLNYRSNLGKIRELQRIMEKCGEGLSIPTPFGAEYHETNWAKGITV